MYHTRFNSCQVYSLSSFCLNIRCSKTWKAKQRRPWFRSVIGSYPHHLCSLTNQSCRKILCGDVLKTKKITFLTRPGVWGLQITEHRQHCSWSSVQKCHRPWCCYQDMPESTYICLGQRLRPFCSFLLNIFKLRHHQDMSLVLYIGLKLTFSIHIVWTVRLNGKVSKSCSLPLVYR